MGNPFLDQLDELFTLNMANVMDESVAKTVRLIEKLKTYLVFLLFLQVFLILRQDAGHYTLQ